MAWTLNGNSGIYQIRNKINNKIYIGSSKNLVERERTHFVNLRINHHTNKHLQASFNKYGSENFVFETLLTCHPDMLIWYEQQFLDQWKPEYNKANRRRLHEIKSGKRLVYKGWVAIQESA